MTTFACPVCKHLACVCVVKRRHDEDCPFRISVTCAIPIECEHGYDTCPLCDPCNCGAGISKEDFSDSRDIIP